MNSLIFRILLAVEISCFAVAGIEHYIADTSWPKYTTFGQLSAVSTDSAGHVYVFHRGNRVWDADTFRLNNRLSSQIVSAGPIRQNTVLILDSSGELVVSTGKDIFFLPHGLTVDDEMNVWVTDVGLHQVLKFPPVNKEANASAHWSPVFTLGKALEPGSGRSHFCKPTSVAIDSRNKDFFVADGYCNSRIIKYDRKGSYLIEWGKETVSSPFVGVTLGPFNLQVPHSLALDEARNQLIVADRENSRILFYTINGRFVSVLPGGGRDYGVAFSPANDAVYAVTGSFPIGPGKGFEYSLKRKNVTALFGSFKNAHDIAVSHDGLSVYVVELDPFKVWKFMVGKKIETSSESGETKIRRVNPVGQAPSGVSSGHGNSPQSAADEEEVDVSNGDVSAEPSFRFSPDSFSGLQSNQLALSVVSAAILLAVILVTCHLKKKRGEGVPMERRGLILGEDDN